VKTSKPPRGADTVPVTFRLSVDEAIHLQRRAEASLLSRSAYIASCLSGEEPQIYPALAALGRVIAIHASLREGGRATDEQLRELRTMIAELAKSSRGEMS